MIKKSIYPKTERVKVEQSNVCEVTEKLDGSNLCIFKKNGVLYIATRNYIISDKDTTEEKTLLYRGLSGWLVEHSEALQKELREGSCICGEWLRNG